MTERKLHHPLEPTRRSLLKGLSGGAIVVAGIVTNRQPATGAAEAAADNAPASSSPSAVVDGENRRSGRYGSGAYGASSYGQANNQNSVYLPVT